MSNDAKQTAYNPSAPAAERFDAQSELQKAHTDLSSLLPPEHLRPVIDHIISDLREQELMKAASNVVPFPSRNAGKRGMQSVRVDDLSIPMMGEYVERPGALGFDSLRMMVDQTPVLNAVLLTRIRQVQAFCKVQESGIGPGFVIRHVDPRHRLTDDDRTAVNLLEKFFIHSGWEFNPRRRKMLGRDSMRQMMAKLVRDSLTMDSCAIETEFKRDKSLGIDGLYAVDGATIRLCTEEGYHGDGRVFALQVVQGRIRAAYGYQDLIYEPRNPRSDVNTAGYGLSETELLVRVVTGFLNAMTLNIKGFSDNAIPRGVLHLSGNYGKEDLDAFKRYWNAMVKGVNNAWAVPVLVSSDQESRAAFENFGVQFDEMYFSKWMTFLASIICAIYGIAPDEINFESFSASKSALSGSDTAERLADSKDKGLKPLLSYFESLFSDYVLAEFGPDYVFRWAGIDDVDEDNRHELKKSVLSVNEMRSELSYEPTEAEWGDAPLNPSLVGPWMQMQQGQQEPDFQGAEQRPGFGEPGGPQGDPDVPGQDDPDSDPRDELAGSTGEDGPGGDQEDEEGAPFGKSFDEVLAKASAHGVGIDDEVFFDHPERGVCCGRVAAYGADGFMVEGEGGKPEGITWDRFRGHKKRADRQFRVIDRGEAGAIVEDATTGRRHFIAGELGDDDEDDAEWEAERALVLGADEDEESEKRNG